MSQHPMEWYAGYLESLAARIRAVVPHSISINETNDPDRSTLIDIQWTNYTALNAAFTEAPPEEK